MQQVIRTNSALNPVLRQNAIGDLEYLTFPSLERTGMVGHLFTTRTGGVSQGIYSSMNLSFTRGDEVTAVSENYRRIGQVLGCAPERMVASHQTHTTNIRLVTEDDCGKGIVRERDYEDVDGLITDTPGICLVTYYADCVPLYLVDPVRRAIGLAHSGWRGTVNRMGECMVRQMQETFGSNPSDLIAAIGPSICVECYEVSEDVASQFEVQFRGMEVVRQGRNPGKYQLDLWLANQLVLMQAGVLEERISVTDICTCHNPDYLFSHRASQGKRGNLAAFLYILNKFSENA
ncbi:MAG: peptidoglycan editing factor PgeF [Acetatifactor sp.]|nr:peptidoglycan editing factor PgeF [Acetatifactor sp.]